MTWMPRGFRGRKETFREGDAVEIVRDPVRRPTSADWTPATYVKADTVLKGWHRVEVDAFKTRVLVPERRIRARPPAPARSSHG